ncbi:MAG: serine/threonine protein kinase, partial [Planctomycetaceae bacterium]|nr:serine/threonine protein kinase [Planctomycetaceae bacterium]
MMNPSLPQDDNSLKSQDEEYIAKILLEADRKGKDAVNWDQIQHERPHLVEEIRDVLEVASDINSQFAPFSSEIPSIPKRLGDYRIQRLLATGGMGAVYEAIQEPFERRVALKIIRQERISPDARRRFIQEQNILARLHQTNIVPIHSAGHENDLQYFAMPLIEGATLDRVIRMARGIKDEFFRSSSPSFGELARVVIGEPANAVEPPFDEDRALASTKTSDESVSEKTSPPPPADFHHVRFLGREYFRSAARVMADLCRAVQHAHEACILHRDLKPSNIMVDRHEQAWVIDFGLGGQMKANPTDSQGPDQIPLTSTTGIGTPRYMAPEQFEDQADVRSDVWGLGVVFYELLVLQPAFSGESRNRLKEQICAKPNPLPRETVKNLPRELEAIVLKAMSKNPEKRYQSAQAMGQDLQHWLDDLPTTALPPNSLERVWKWSKRNPGWATFWSATLLLLTGLVFFLHREAKAQEQEVERQKAEAKRQELLIQVSTTEIDPQKRQNDWRTRIRDSLKEAQQIRSDDDIATAFSITLAGMDASVLNEWAIPASRVSFRKDDRKVLLAGPQQTNISFLIDLPNSQPRRLAGLTPYGGGPVGFDPQNHPCRIASINPWAFQVENLHTQRVSSTFSLASDEIPPDEQQAWKTASQDDRRRMLMAVNSLAQATPDFSHAVLWLGRSQPTDDPSSSGTIVLWDQKNQKVLNKVKSSATALAISGD